MSRGPSLGTVSYNGWEFPGPVVVKLRCTPVRDFAGRTTKYYHYSINFTTTIVPTDLDSYATTNDPFLGSLRATLMQPGKLLTVTGHGLGGDISLDCTSCIGFGPIPTDYQFEVIGANLAGRLVWSCEFDAPHCWAYGISPPQNQIGDLSFALNYSIDESGLTTRTITGQAEVAVFLTQDLQHITATADLLIDIINPILPEGFMRRKSYTISPDKRFLNFVVTDRELGTSNVYPDQIVHADLDFDIRGDATKDAFWDCELGGTLEVAQGYAKGFALEAVLQIAKQRIDGIQKSIRQQDNNKKKGAVVLTTFHLSDSLFSPRMRVSLAWRVTGATLKYLLANSGLWEPVGVSWDKWQKSDGIKASVLAPRGYANLSSQATDDIVVSFCQPGAPYSGPKQQGPLKPYSSSITHTNYNSDNSWIKYDLNLSYSKESATILHRAATSAKDSQTPLAPTNTGLGGRVTGGVVDKGTYAAGVGNKPTLVLQERANAEGVLILTGHAIRVGYPIEGGDLAAIDQGAHEENVFIDGPKRIGFTPERISIYEVKWKRIYRQIVDGPWEPKVKQGTVPTSQVDWLTYAPS